MSAQSAGSLDTNIILRLLLNDIPDQRVTAKHLLEKTDGIFEIADASIVEVVFVMSRYYELGRGDVSKGILDFITQPNINSNQILFKKALNLFVNRPALSFEDCCLSVYAEINQAEPLWTFDKKLAAQAPNAKLVER